MKLIHYILALALIMPLFLTCEDEEDEEARKGKFTLVFRNQGSACNTTTLNFTFLATRTSDGSQESHTVAPGSFEVGRTLNFSEGEVLNIQVFAASSESPLHEANIPFIYTNFTDAELQSNTNDLNIRYCHEEDIGNITWTFDL